MGALKDLVKEIEVNIGEIRIAQNGESLKAIVGACVGIGLIWKKKGICGLAHCILPESPEKGFIIDGKFVDLAVPSLLTLMKIRKESLSEIEAVVVGGGNVTNPGAINQDELIGSKNFKTAERELKKAGIRICHMESGYGEGRKLIINSFDCSFRVEVVRRTL